LINDDLYGGSNHPKPLSSLRLKWGHDCGNTGWMTYFNSLLAIQLYLMHLTSMKNILMSLSYVHSV